MTLCVATGRKRQWRRLETTQSSNSTTSPFIYFFKLPHPYHEIRPETDTALQSSEEVIEHNLP